MCDILPLGALIKGTTQYVYPKIAKKTDKFECPDCHNDLIVRQGNIRIHHFAHKADSSCEYYSHPTESQIHRDAKMLLKTLFERKTHVYIDRPCCGRFPVPVMTDTSKIVLEHRFDYNGPKVADVAYLKEDKLAYIFEICHTHKTSSDRRPEPWFEIDAKALLKNSNDYNIVAIMQCIRRDTCGECLKKIEIERLRRDNVDVSVKPLRYIYLDVPYEEKNVAKRLGAQYDFKKYKKWMIRSDHHNMAELVTEFPIWKTVIIDENDHNDTESNSTNTIIIPKITDEPTIAVQSESCRQEETKKENESEDRVIYYKDTMPVMSMGVIMYRYVKGEKICRCRWQTCAEYTSEGHIELLLEKEYSVYSDIDLSPMFLNRSIHEDAESTIDRETGCIIKGKSIIQRAYSCKKSHVVYNPNTGHIIFIIACTDEEMRGAGYILERSWARDETRLEWKVFNDVTIPYYTDTNKLSKHLNNTNVFNALNEIAVKLNIQTQLDTMRLQKTMQICQDHNIDSEDPAMYVYDGPVKTFQKSLFNKKI